MSLNLYFCSTKLYDSMNIRFLTMISFLFLALMSGIAQTGSITGSVYVEGEELEFATVLISDSQYGTTTNIKGNYQLNDIPFGTYELEASYVGYKPITKQITLSAQNSSIKGDFTLTEKTLDLDLVVVTGTKTFKRG